MTTHTLSKVFSFVIIIPLFALPACTAAPTLNSTASTSTISTSATTPRVQPAHATKATSQATLSPPTPQLANATSTKISDHLMQPCSPLKGYARTELPDLIHNPFNPPPIGKDDPHQGVDFAIVKDSIAIPGTKVQAILPGTVAAVVSDRFPYGNAIMIETPMKTSQVDAQWTQFIPTIAPTLSPLPALNCPQPLPNLQAETRSIYVLYAHLQEPPKWELNDKILCGEVIGKIGMSGNAINPHLHIEARIGPSNTTFASLCHYDTSATKEEMQNYCLWRVTNLFQLIDPMKLFSTQIHLNQNP